MGKDIIFDIKGLENFKKRLQKIEKEEATRFFEELSREIAARLLAKVIKRTPVKMGTLRRGWTGGGAAKAFAGALDVKRSGKSYTVVISNNVEYASYVEYGHRQTPGRFVEEIGKRLVKDWVEGKFMLTLSEHELEGQVGQIIEKKLSAWLSRLGGA